MGTGKSRFIVTPQWVEERIASPGFSIIDASWYLPAHGRDGAAEYAAAHVPSAVFFDHDRVADQSTGLPHSLPSPEQFAAEMERLGVSNRDLIVVYDGPGFFSAPRLWWMLRIMGADAVFLMDGGFDGWKAASRPVETKTREARHVRFKTDFRSERVTSLAEMRQLVASGATQIADARGAGRFEASEPEPRPGMRGGHMPGARNLPATGFSEGGHFRDLGTLASMFEEAGIDLSKPVVTSCGSGVTAAIITLALESLGHDDNSLYDGSWSEWGSLADTPIVTGKA
ncbi:3-mercaptopyruvate sulfurtransferase [Martelella sp. HB161492]|uniref:3-mercaptopyruvate sulfurtransferase n=1 Tax=Martelella sp. HB161492 TaxID=2720726 RepID=UPI001591F010|nr:3-mercaptopyruvate sulfurtransferase [Martelella sp. HB161492]